MLQEDDSEDTQVSDTVEAADDDEAAEGDDDSEDTKEYGVLDPQHWPHMWQKLGVLAYLYADNGNSLHGNLKAYSNNHAYNREFYAGTNISKVIWSGISILKVTYGVFTGSLSPQDT